MQFPEVAVSSLKWLSQFIVFLSATSAMFQDLYTENLTTGRRRLTKSGWVHLAGLLTGFIVFGVTEIRDQQKAARDRVDAARREAQQTAQVESLKSVLAKQEGIETGLRTQIEQGKTWAIHASLNCGLRPRSHACVHYTAASKSIKMAWLVRIE